MNKSYKKIQREPSIPVIKGYSFHYTSHNKEHALEFDKKKFTVQSIFLELESICNFRCPYCYTSADKNTEPYSLSYSEIMQLICEAKKMGVKSIVIAGKGEPLLSKYIWKLVELITSLNMWLVIFTNGSCLNKNKAKRLHCNNVSVILKLNSLNPNVQDVLIGVKNGHESVFGALELLLNCGFQAPRFGIQSIITKINMKDLRELFIFCRNKSIVPYFETYVAIGRAADPMVRKLLEPNRLHILQFFQEIQELDKTLCGFNWEICSGQRVIAYGPCNKNRHMLTISSNGDVYRCVTESERLGNIKDNPLETILCNPKIISKLLNPVCVGCSSVSL